MSSIKHIIQSGKASLQHNNKVIKGKLHLTVDTIVFVPNNQDVEIFNLPLIDIAKIRASQLFNLFSKKLLVQTNTNSFVLQIDYPNTWRELIEEQVICCR